MAKTISYLTVTDIASTFRIGVDNARTTLEKLGPEIPGAFKDARKTWHVPAGEAEKVFSKYRNCLRVKEAAAAIGVSENTVSRWLHDGKTGIVFYRPKYEGQEVPAGTRPGATYVDMDSLRAYAAKMRQSSEKAAPVAQPQPQTESMLVQEVRTLRGSIYALNKTMENLAGPSRVEVPPIFIEIRDLLKELVEVWKK